MLLFEENDGIYNEETESYSHEGILRRASLSKLCCILFLFIYLFIYTEQQHPQLYRLTSNNKSENPFSLHYGWIAFINSFWQYLVPSKKNLFEEQYVSNNCIIMKCYLTFQTALKIMC